MVECAIREFAQIIRPNLKITRPWRPKPPERNEDIQLRDLVALEVRYPSYINEIHIPDEHLLAIIREVRKNLEFAIHLEMELGGYRLDHLCPIEFDPGLEGESYERTEGLSGFVLFFVDLLNKLITKDCRAAKLEYLSWWTNGDKVFERLRIWISGNKDLFPIHETGRLICKLSNDSFWNNHHQRDLMLVLARRWSDFSDSVRKKLEKRLLRGRSRFKKEKKAEYIVHRAWFTLSRIHWLYNQGCRFSFDLHSESEKLQVLAPEWKPQYAAKAAASMEGTGGCVQIDTECSALLCEPLSNILSRAKELSSIRHGWLFEKDPFAGLIAERPIRAFVALSKAAKRKDYPEWAWRTFLYSEERKKDKPRFAALIACRLSQQPEMVIAGIIFPISDWMNNLTAVLLSNYPEHFWRLWDQLISTLKVKPEIAKSAIVRDDLKRDWMTEAINSPVGKLAESLMKVTEINTVEDGKCFPVNWLNRIDKMFSLEGDLHRHAIVIFALNLGWFFARDPLWTEKSLLSLIDKEDNDQCALWAGFFHSAKIPSPILYRRLRNDLLNLAGQKSIYLSKHSYSKILPGIVLAGWDSINEETDEPFVSAIELRNVLLNANEDFRSQMLWTLKAWSTKDSKWQEKIKSFLIEVWPRQRKVKSSRITNALLDIVFSEVSDFPSIADIILPLLTEINRSNMTLYNLKKSNLIEEYPDKILMLLFTALSKNASLWPYYTDVILERIGKANTSLIKDSRLIELKRRWSAR
jgi:hypothetical protein